MITRSQTKLCREKTSKSVQWREPPPPPPLPKWFLDEYAKPLWYPYAYMPTSTPVIELDFPEKPQLVGGNNMRQRRLQRDIDYANQCGKLVNDYLKKTYPNPEDIRKYIYLAISNLHFDIDNRVKKQKRIQNIGSNGHIYAFWFIYYLDPGYGRIMIRGVESGAVYTFGYEVEWQPYPDKYHPECPEFW